MHSWLIDATGTLIDSAERDEHTRYFGVPWSRELLDAVNATPGHDFEDILEDGLRSSVSLARLQGSGAARSDSGRPSLPSSLRDRITALK